MHRLRPREHIVRRGDPVGHASVMGETLEDLRVLIADHEHARAGTEDRSQLAGVEETFDGDVDDEGYGRKGGYRAGLAIESKRRAGRPQGNRGGACRCAHDDLEGLCSEGFGGQDRGGDELRTARALGEDDAFIAGTQAIEPELLGESRDPAPFGRGARTAHVRSQ